MATVPGNPSNVTPMMPKWAQPTPADFLQAAAIMEQKGKFRVAGDVLDMSGTFRDQQELVKLLRQNPDMPSSIAGKAQTQETLTRALGSKSNVLPITPKDK